ncbi:tetratricopeptide repeat protein [Labilibacter marinus]|uniref:tetratricopeptide repeat protein n=1 Tax=Labilibacter marinus TaxID=1477105 RepID=UPI0009501095|nr:hypothetical protein [Labilibacter marinus]
METTKRLIRLISVAFIMASFSFSAVAQNLYLPASTKSKEAKQLYQKAMDAYTNSEWFEGREFAKQALEKDASFFMGHYLLTYNEDKEEREKYIQLVSDFDGKLNKGEKILQQIVINYKGDEETVLKHYSDLVKAYPKVAFTHLMLAYHLNRYGHTDKALASINSTLDLHSDFAPANNMKGYILMKKNKMDEAKVAFDKYIELAPNRANPYDSKGDYFMAQKEYKKAKEHFNKAFELNSHFTYSQKKAKKAMFTHKCEMAKPEVEKIMSDMVEYYNLGELDKFQSYFADNGTFKMVINGEKVFTLKDLKELQAKNIASLKTYKVSIDNEIIHMMNPKKAMVTQKFNVTGKFKDGKILTEEGNWTLYWNKWEDTWKVTYAVENVAFK